MPSPSELCGLLLALAVGLAGKKAIDTVRALMCFAEGTTHLRVLRETHADWNAADYFMSVLQLSPSVTLRELWSFDGTGQPQLKNVSDIRSVAELGGSIACGGARWR
jgi:hypothetical protein